MLIVLCPSGLRTILSRDLKVLINPQNWICFPGKVYSAVRLRTKPWALDYQSSACNALGFNVEPRQISCKFSNCLCGNDLGLLKARDQESLDLFLNSLAQIPSDIQPWTPLDGDVLAVRELNLFKTFEYYVGKRCNFDCSYCPASIHDSFSPLPTLEQLHEGWNFGLKSLDYKDDQLNVWISGGEPVVIPQYIEFLKDVKKPKMHITTLTNGSRKPSYYMDLLPYSDIYITIHLAYVTPMRLQYWRELAGNPGVKFKILYDVEHRDAAKSALEAIRGRGSYWSVEPLHDKKSYTMNHYDEEDLEFLKQSGK